MIRWAYSTWLISTENDLIQVKEIRKSQINQVNIKTHLFSAQAQDSGVIDDDMPHFILAVLDQLQHIQKQIH